MGDTDVAEAIPGEGRLESGAGETPRGESPDDPRAGPDEAVGPGPVDRRLALLAAAGGGAQAGPLQAIINSRLDEFPGLSAQRLFDEVRAAGYPGGYTGVRNYVRTVRPNAAAELVVRSETAAGRQGQVDFATFSLPWGHGHAVVAVLSYSRLQDEYPHRHIRQS